MSISHFIEPNWYLLEALLEWVKVLAATHIGLRFVRAYANRSRGDANEHALQHRVKELEQETAALGSQLHEVLDAERFTVALLLRGASADGAQSARALETTRSSAASRFHER